MGRIFMIKLNSYVGTWDLRRVAPKIELVSHMEDSNCLRKIEMCPLMKFTTRMDTKLQRQFNTIEQSYNQEKTTDRERSYLIAYNMKRVALNDTILNKFDIDLLQNV